VFGTTTCYERNIGSRKFPAPTTDAIESDAQRKEHDETDGAFWIRKPLKIIKRPSKIRLLNGRNLRTADRSRNDREHLFAVLPRSSMVFSRSASRSFHVAGGVGDPDDTRATRTGTSERLWLSTWAAEIGRTTPCLISNCRRRRVCLSRT